MHIIKAFKLRRESKTFTFKGWTSKDTEPCWAFHAVIEKTKKAALLRFIKVKPVTITWKQWEE